MAADRRHRSQYRSDPVAAALNNAETRAMPGKRDVLSFEGYVLDGARRCVTRPDGSPLALTPRLFSALYLFASRPGELIDKRELMQTLWPGLVVEENNLSQLISALRRAFGEEAGQLIRTEPRRGFRFT